MDFCVDPNWLSVKEGWADKDAVIGLERDIYIYVYLVSYHLGSLLSAIELSILCACVCKVGYFDA